MSKGKIVVFDNLVEPHSSGIIGLTQKVKIVCSLENLPQLRETSLRAQKAAEKFKKMFSPASGEQYVHESVRGEPWRPKNVDEVSDRARESAAKFCEMFQSGS